MNNAHSTPPDRLTGWKEIAGYLDRGVRTVQRWEKEAGLPIRRVGPPGGESVFALRQELDAWLLAGGGERADSLPHNPSEADDRNGVGGKNDNGNGAESPPPAAPRRWWSARRVAAVAAVSLSAVLLLVAALTLSSWPDGRTPVTSDVREGRIRILDDAGRVLWTAAAHSSCDGRSQVSCRDVAAVADIDDDGHVEVLVVQPYPDSTVLCYDDGLKLRSRLPQPKEMQYGDGRYGPPFDFQGVLVDDQRRVWVWGKHHDYYPSFLWRVRLDATGQLTMVDQYWSPGFITTVRALRLRGRDTLLVGAFYNDDDARGASLAVFFDGRIGGAGPVSSPLKRCPSCEKGGPELMFTFPRSPILELEGSEAASWFQRFEGIGNNSFTAVIEAAPAGDTTGPESTPSYARYTFDAAFELTHRELSHFDVAMRRYQARGLHPRAWTSADLLPIRLWRAGRPELIRDLSDGSSAGR